MLTDPLTYASFLTRVCSLCLCLIHSLGPLLIDLSGSCLVLRSYSRRIRSEGLRPQLVRCAPFPSTVPYFKVLR
ncbi:hypothetical protein BDR06DRAFT_197046 [Suillus hirtellus]|nr:hypothetical protein BDR06DRAFT_197046 [Suillus hirtellus]